MKPLRIPLLAGLAPMLVGAQGPSFETAQEAIKAQQGCFEVTFQYEEVQAHQDGYVLAPPKKSSVLEWVSVDHDSADKIILQHVLVTPPRIKHWKQIWTFEGTEFDAYSGLNEWTHHTVSPSDAAGAWVQVVRGVADNPRYGCSAPWSLDGDAAWSCQTWAAKPRRDKDRDDYNILQRNNTHRIHAGGWVHEQRNTKLQVSGDQVTPIVTEVGNNTYDRVDDEQCAKAAAWWEKRTATWSHVQRAWDDAAKPYGTYTVNPKRGLFPLWIRLFWLARKPLPEKKHARFYQRAVRIIEQHLQGSQATRSWPEDHPQHPSNVRTDAPEHTEQ